MKLNTQFYFAIALACSLSGCARDVSLVQAISNDLRRMESLQARGRLQVFPDKLMNAVSNTDVARVTTLLRFGHDVNVEDSRGNTPLILAAYGDGSIAISRLHGGENVFPERYRSKTNRKLIEIVRLLLTHGADPNHETSLGNTPLAQALSTGQLEIERLLRKAGATNEGRWTARP